MQATVRSFSHQTASGTVLLDDGVELPYDAEAFASSNLRHLRVGQRLTVVVTAAGPSWRVSAMSLRGV